MKIYILWLLIFTNMSLLHGQDMSPSVEESSVDELMGQMWENPISFFNKDDENWRMLCKGLQRVDSVKIGQIVQSTFSDSLRASGSIENGSEASEGLMGWLNKKSQKRKSKKFERKSKHKYSEHPQTTVLIEGDSWFEYPLFLHEITDQLIKKSDLSIHSLAAGGDWIANMISSQEYQYEYTHLQPDVFIISGGGNDLVQDYRLVNYISTSPIAKDSPFLLDYKKYVILRMNDRPVPLCKVDFCPIEYHYYEDSISIFQSHLDTVLINSIVNGRRYLNKEYYQKLVSIKLEYKILFESIRKSAPAHFDSLKIITQGYDYAIPNSGKKFGSALLLSNGQWLQKPLISIGITDEKTQQSIIQALMFDFNEMLIELGKEYPNIYHVDVRGFTRFMEIKNNKKKGAYWFDELHPTNYIFQRISEVYYDIISQATVDQHIFKVKDYYSN